MLPSQTITYKAFICWRLYSWFDVKDEFVLISTLGVLQVTSQFTFVVSLDAFQFFLTANRMTRVFQAHLLHGANHVQESHPSRDKLGLACTWANDGMWYRLFCCWIFWVDVVFSTLSSSRFVKSCNPVNAVSVVDIHVSHEQPLSSMIWTLMVCFTRRSNSSDDWYQVREPSKNLRGY